MKMVSDPIMDEVYAIRHDLSMESGHDVSAYFNVVRNEKREAESIGMTYFEYCLARLNRIVGDCPNVKRADD